MFFDREKKENAAILAQLTTYVDAAGLTDRERKIGELAMADIQKNVYNAKVVNRVMISLQQEALVTKLSPAAAEFYETMNDTMNKIAPIGTNRANMLFRKGYLE